jgi:hypothetical protein
MHGCPHSPLLSISAGSVVGAILLAPPACTTCTQSQWNVCGACDLHVHNPPCLPVLLLICARRGFCLPCGYGHYVRLMDEFGIVVDVFLSLEDGFRRVIADITRRMGEGMADFIEKEVRIS